MVTTHLPRLVVNTIGVDEGIFKLLAIIRPKWVKDEVHMENLSRGSSFFVYKCYCNRNPEEAIITKIVNSSDDSRLKSTNIFEHEALKEVSKAGYFPRIIAVFVNGYCYDFIKGKTLFDPHSLPFNIDEHVLKEIANCMCGIHAVKIEGVSYTRTNFFERLQTILENFYEEKPALPDREVLRKELSEMEEIIEELHFTLPLTLCHGNVHPGNIIWNNEQGSVTFIDWALVHIGYQAAEVAYFLQKINLLVSFKNVPNTIPDNYEEIFLKSYLEHWFERTDRKAEQVTENDLTDFGSQVNFFKPIVNLSFLIMSSFYDEDIDTNKEEGYLTNIELANKIFDEYLKLKKEICN